MSWPNNWQVQPGYTGYSTAVPPPTAAAAAAPAAYSQVSSDAQWQQWQQWQQYQQQYAQWHAQYGEQYARQMGKPLPAVPAPMPMPAVAIATSLPPPTIVPHVAPVPPPITTAPPMPMTAAPPPPAEPHPDTLAAGQAPAPPPPAAEGPEGPKTTEELAFDEQFRKWEEEFDNWKRKNANHPDKSAYREYEKKFEECRKKLVERREHLRKKRLAEATATSTSATLQYMQQQQQSQFHQPPPPPPPEEDEENGMDVGLFRNALGGASTSGGGIPGLDLIDETVAPKPQKAKDEEVVEVIDLEEEREDKPDVGQLSDSAKQPANPVNALASLLKDPKVSALLNIISGNNNGQGVNLSSLGNSELLQQIQNAAGAVINANQNGSPISGVSGQNQLHGSGQRTPLSDDRSRASFHDDRRSIVSGDERSRDIDDIRGPQLNRGNDNFHRGPPPNQTNAYNFDMSVPPPMVNVDLSRPPPLFGSNPVPRPLRSEQPSPASSNTSSTSRQRQSRWSNHHQAIKQDSEPELAIKEEPFNGSTFLPDTSTNCYVGHQDELQIDPELGTPCAVPKPDWMEEEEYQEIYDRYEHIEVFEERKYKMELAIRLLEKKKKDTGSSSRSAPAPTTFGTGSDSTSGRWQGGMPKPIKQEPALAPSKRPNPFAGDDDFFRPKQVIDYSNGSPRVIDYGHSSSGPAVAGKFGNTNEANNRDSRDSRDRRDMRFRDGQRFNEQRGERGRFQSDDFQRQRFDYNHTQSCDTTGVGSYEVDRPANYTVNSTSRLATMHRNPNPDESNPAYPSKFILMNDNRPNRPSTKRGKRASSIRKQKLREQQQMGTYPDDSGSEQRQNRDVRSTSGQNGQNGPNVPSRRPNDYELEMKREPEDEQNLPNPSSSSFLPPVPIVHIDDLLLPPGRFKRPQRMCFIFRGLPGSGKSYLARMIKECEVKHGGQAPRVLSIDDYFLVDTEEREPDPVTGRPVLITRSEYQFDAEMEEVYMQNLVKAFKRTITDKLYNFVIVDCVNERLLHYNEFHNFARSNGFKVYTCTLQTEVELCAEQNIHNRTIDEIRKYVSNWELSPDDHVQINASTLLDPLDESAVQTAADMDLCTEEDDIQQTDVIAQQDSPPERIEAQSGLQDNDEDSNIDAPEPVWMASVNPPAVLRR
ncbi:uncharacterized protein LOC129773002 isoform X2 [Toxorhynchites rutilus septentrionalis]|uniref:uncharacterized protein LOC129773002 isoform X2 n=1 Tax=Toxorhynchites rutilus septentrionalis TaxID=329112 RepID=UPI00247AA854|nr:uncharacterized protein LOC129773002 isoform X2 [Toxorhynchites rutilus septentrionalis]